MFYIFGDIRALLKLDTISIDNTVFSLHYKATTILLVTFSLLVTKKQYFGDPIDCIVDAIKSDTIDRYCWIHSTYTVPALTGGRVGDEVAHPGVANVPMERDGTYSLPVRHHKYYQWVVLFLFFQAGLFYIPRYLWKRCEAGRVSSLVGELHMPVQDPNLKRQRLSCAIEYFGRYFHHHNLFAYQFFICEVLNFINVVGQIYFTDKFLGYGFLDYGPRVLNYTTQDDLPSHDPKDEIFPKVAKCAFHKFGPSGSLIRHDALCVLPLNVLNEKIYAFFWFWLVTVALVTGLWLIFRIVTIVAPTLRQALLRHRSRLVEKDNITLISRKCYIGDWFILYLLAKNMDPFVFREFIEGVTVKLTEKEHHS